MFYLDLFRELNKQGVEYLLVGGLALNIHGVERATMDVDLMIALDDSNLRAFILAAGALHMTPVLPVDIHDLADPGKRADWIKNRHMIAFAMRSPDIYGPTVDILIQTGIDFSTAWSHRIEKQVGGTVVNLASIDDLMAMKTGTGRLRDEADVNALKRLRELGLG